MNHHAVITDKAWLRTYLMRDPALHIYELGDLDDFFWPSTRWFALDDRAVVLLYQPVGALPALLAFGDVTPLHELLAELRDQLPPRIHAHLSPGLIDTLAVRYRDESRGDYLKMVLADRTRLPETPGIVGLSSTDRPELEAFYAASYPANWFDPRMLETGQYVGIREHGLVAAGGVHVYSTSERIAALGNIAVAPEHRGRHLGTRVTAALCRSLLGVGIEHVGLNVRADNRAAIACYERLGFATVARFEEHLLVAGAG